MSALKRIEQFLSEHGVRYELIHHARAFTAQQVAEAEHIPGKMHAKVVMLIGDGVFYMAVTPADHQVIVEEFGRLIGRTCRLATEAEFQGLFPDCEIGAMPPFGSFYGLPVFADSSLAEDDEIVIQAGTHMESVKLTWNDYVQLERPVVASFSVSPRLRKVA